MFNTFALSVKRKMLKLFSPAHLVLIKQPQIIVRTIKSDLKIKWVRPERLSCLHPTKSGDNSTMPTIDKTQYALPYQKSEELESADENVKKLFTLAYQSGKETNLLYQEQLVRLVRRHKIDETSIEARIARMTGRIRYLQERCAENPKEKKQFVICKELIERRMKLLKILRRWDYRRFEWLLEKLDLIYKPQPVTKYNIFRKESLIRLTDAHCDKIRNDRLFEYKKQLQAQQVDFLADKIEKLQFVRKEQLELGLDATVSAEDIAEVQKQHDDLKKQREEEMKGVDMSNKWKMF